MDEKFLNCAELPESVLEAFGLNYNNGVAKLELIFDANKFVKIRTTTKDDTEKLELVSIGQLKSFAKAISSL